MSPTPVVCILIVEDDPTVSAALRGLLADEAIATLSATSLREARNFVRTRNVIGVLLDYTLPDGTAADLLRDLTNAEYPPGVVIASAHPDAQRIAKQFSIECIRKPLDLDVVLAAVRGFIAGTGQPVAPS
jgi:DNA-binding response OmpR family regulator